MAEATESNLTRSVALSPNYSSPWAAPFQAGAPWRSQCDVGLGGKAELWSLSLQPMPVPPWHGAKGLFDLVSEMCDFDLHPSVLPLPRFWLQNHAVIASTLPRRCVVTLPASHIGSRQGELAIVCTLILPGPCDTTPEQTKTIILPLRFPNPSHSSAEG